MLIVSLALAAVTLAHPSTNARGALSVVEGQQPAPPPATQPAQPTPDLAVISGRLGPCSADFTVTDADGKPIYAAIVHVRIRYGFMSVKRMDLEVGTNSDGKARVEGLPEKARPLTYDVTKDTLKGTVRQDLAANCKATFAVALK
jgi:hypothetical protein